MIEEGPVARPSVSALEDTRSEVSVDDVVDDSVKAADDEVENSMDEVELFVQVAL